MNQDTTIIRVFCYPHNWVAVKIIDRHALNCGSTWHDDKDILTAYRAALTECGLIGVSDDCRVQVLASWSESDIKHRYQLDDGDYPTIEALLVAVVTPDDTETMLTLVKRINRTLSEYDIRYDDAGVLRAEIAKFAAMLNALAAVEDKVD